MLHAPKIHTPFQVTQEDIERTNTLEPEDEGKWALLVAGCYHFFESRIEAQECRNKLNGA